MRTSGQRAQRILITGVLSAMLGWICAFLFFPILLLALSPWGHVLPWPSPLGIPWHPRVEPPNWVLFLEQAAGFGLLGACLGFVGGVLRGMRDDRDEGGEEP